MKIYTIIGGVNGVGKSSFTGVLKERTTDLGIIIDVDKITAELGGDLLIGGKASINKIDDCIAKRISFTQETTLSGRRTENTAKKVKDLGYHVRLFYVGLDTVEESLERIKNATHPGAIYLLHAVSKTNSNILADVIDNIRAEGYTFSEFNL